MANDNFKRTNSSNYDIVPLIGENRFLVVKGLELIANGKHYGLKRMLDVAGVNIENGLTAEQVAFSIASSNVW